MILHLFLVSSPLQAIVAENIRIQYLNNSADSYYAYCEGKRLVGILNVGQWTKIVVGENTRPSTENARKNIKHNLTQLTTCLEFCPERVILYISDLSWLFNNVVYAFLKKKYKLNFECVVFDEGTVTYRVTRFSWREKVNAILKYVWLLAHGFPSKLTIRSAIPLGDELIKKLYCYHPELISPSLTKKVLKDKLMPLNPNYLEFKFHIPELELLNDKSVLFLSQPYYRVMPEDEYEHCISAMIKYFHSSGYKNFFIKPHDADKIGWLDKLKEKYSMVLLGSIQSIPIEMLARYLNCGVLVSVCSSSLMNLALFGFKGRIVSFGMRRCSVNKAIKNSHDRARVLYQYLGVEVID